MVSGALCKPSGYAYGIEAHLNLRYLGTLGKLYLDGGSAEACVTGSSLGDAESAEILVLLYCTTLHPSSILSYP